VRLSVSVVLVLFMMKSFCFGGVADAGFVCMRFLFLRLSARGTVGVDWVSARALVFERISALSCFLGSILMSLLPASQTEPVFFVLVQEAMTFLLHPFCFPITNFAV